MTEPTGNRAGPSAVARRRRVNWKKVGLAALIVATLIAFATQGERLQASADREGAFCRIAVSQPRGLAGGAAPELELRLVRGLARVVGGDVSVESGSVLLALPAA